MQHEKRIVHHHQSTKKEEMIRNIKAEQALKLTLTPKDIDHYGGGRTNQHPPRKQHQQSTTTATTTQKQHSSRRTRDSYNEQELLHQDKMERARQNMLSKMQQENQGWLERAPYHACLLLFTLEENYQKYTIKR